MSSDLSAKNSWKGHRDRLRHKLITRGAQSLEDYELLETLLCAFIPRRDVKPVAKNLLVRFGSLSGLFAADTGDILKLAGIGKTSAAYIKAVQEISIRSARETIQVRPMINGWPALLSYVRLQLQHETREQFRVLFFDHKNHLLTDEVLGQGTTDRAPVYPREIARRTLELAASSIILVHNHPSGDSTPSRSDIDITRALIDSLAPFDIDVHDHLIVSRHGVTSLKANGLI